MVVGSVAKNRSQAETAGWVLVIPFLMLSGILFPLNQALTTFKDVAYFFPFAHSVDAAREALNTETSFLDIAPDLYWLIGYSIVFFVLGIIFFKKNKQI